MSAARVGPGPFKYHLVRLVLAAVLRAYVRISVEGADRLPQGGSYIICFNHPSWLDPVVLAVSWPDRERRLFVFGPREQDMSTGWRNHLITWTGRSVAFKPGAQDIIDTTRRAMKVLHAESCLAIAGEGRLSDHPGIVRPLETGLGHFAMLAGVPIVPAGVIGTRWIHLGSRIRVRIGEPVQPTGFGPGKTGARAMTDIVQERLQALVEGVPDGDPPGWLGRTISEAFNDRPWLDELEQGEPPGGSGGADATPGDRGADAADGGASRRD